MKLFRLTTTLATTIGLALATVSLAANAAARYAPEPPAGDSAQLVTPPPVNPSGGGTSVWWFVLVAVAAIAAAVLVMVAVRALRPRRMAPATTEVSAPAIASRRNYATSSNEPI